MCTMPHICVPRHHNGLTTTWHLPRCNAEGDSIQPQPLFWKGGAKVPLQGRGRLPAGQLFGGISLLPPCDFEAGIEGTCTIHLPISVLPPAPSTGASRTARPTN